MTPESTTEIQVHRSVSVPLPPERAFDLFTARMTEFWPKEHSIGSAAIAQVVVEPRAGRTLVELRHRHLVSCAGNSFKKPCE